LKHFKYDPEEKFSWRGTSEKRKCGWFGHDTFGWKEPIDIEKDYQQVLKQIASGEFQQLRKEVEMLKKEIELLKNIKTILITEEAFIEVWDNEYDDWWDDV
jgi:hypothetical protein